MSEQRFTALLEKDRVVLPFDPDAAWGARERHHVTGSVAGRGVRGALRRDARGWSLVLGPAWRRDNPLPEEFEVALSPEGPQFDALSPDLAAALNAEPEAKAFFTDLATFFRKGYVDWIESAKRPETRQSRIAETVACLKDGKKAR